MIARLRRLAIDTTPLRHPAYRRLFVGNGVSFVGFQITAVAVPVQVYDISRSSFWVGMVGLVGLVPLIVFGLWGGAVADAVDRRLLLLVSSTVTFVVTVALLAQALLQLGNLALILVLVGMQSAAFAVSSPTRNAIIPRLLRRELVPAANTLSFTMSNVGMVLGPLLAGVVIARTGGFAAAYAIDAFLFTVALYAVLRLPALPPLTAETARPGLRSVIDGLRFIAGRPVLLMSFAVDIIAMVFAMPRALFPEVAETRFGGGAAVGWLFAAIAIGARARRAVVRLDRPGAPAGRGADRRGRRLGDRGGAVRAGDLAVGGGLPARGRRRRRPGLRGVPADDPAGVRPGRDARPAAGRLHRGGGRRSAAG